MNLFFLSFIEIPGLFLIYNSTFVENNPCFSCLINKSLLSLQCDKKKGLHEEETEIQGT